MTGSPSLFLIDTNVLVYAYDPSDAAKRDQAIRLLKSIAARGLGAVSAQILGEFFVAVTKKLAVPLTAAEAERSVINYARAWTTLDLTAFTVQEATRGAQRHRMSYWDSLVWATAKLNQIPNVLSEDFSDRAVLEGVRFLNPFADSFDLDRLVAIR